VFDEGDRLAIADPALLDAYGLPDLSLLQARSQGQHLVVSATGASGADLNVRIQHVERLDFRDLFDVPDNLLTPYTVMPGGGGPERHRARIRSGLVQGRARGGAPLRDQPAPRLDGGRAAV
jgi:hypothetical protein